MAKSKIMAKVRTSLIHLFRLILMGKFTSNIIFVVQGHLQSQKVNLKVK